MLIQNINYNHLYYFYVVASEGSVKAACHRLNLTQPTVSGQIRSLENDLGANLFDRKFRSVELNDFGKEVFQIAEKIFSLGNEISNLNGKNKKSLSRSVSIGVVQSVPNSKVRKLVSGLWSMCNCRVEVHFEEFKNLIDELNAGQLDLVLTDTSPGHSHHNVLNIGSDRVICVTSPDLQKDLKENFPYSLNDVPYVSLNNSSQMQSQINFFIRSQGIKPKVMGSVDDAAFIIDLTKMSFCFAILPEEVCRPSLLNNELVEIGEISEVRSSSWLMVSNLIENEVDVSKLFDIFQLESSESDPKYTHQKVSTQDRQDFGVIKNS